MYIAFDFQIQNTPDGYVVSAFVAETPSTSRVWKPLRNFGGRQGDAIMETACKWTIRHGHLER